MPPPDIAVLPPHLSVDSSISTLRPLSAAAGNRLALLDAARRVFAAQGYRAPLSAIAREAAVGQAVLYRHFPTRLDLALAVFEQNFTELETIAAEPDSLTFGRLWLRLVELSMEESAFIEMVVDARRTLPDQDLDDRLRRLIDATLPRAQAAGLARGDLKTSDLALVMRMVFGIVVMETDPASKAASVARGLALIAVETPREG